MQARTSQAFLRRQKRIKLTTTTTAAVNQTALNRLNGLNIFNLPWVVLEFYGCCPASPIIMIKVQP